MKNKINMLSFEDYSLSLSYNEERGYYEYVGCNNRSIVRKGSFVHLMASMGKRDFAVLDAYSCGLSKEENVRSNRGMREVLQASSLQAYCLVCRTQAGTVARHYLVERPDAMPSEEFERCMADCLKAGLCRDRAALYRRQSEYLFLYPDGTIANGAPVLTDDTVVGVEEPATNMGRMMYARHGLCYPSAFCRQGRKIKVVKSVTNDESEHEPNPMSHDRGFIKRLREGRK